MTLQAQIKWVSNIADFKAQVASGTDAVVAHTASVDKLTRSLSGNGLFGAVNNAVAAIDKMGGVQKLTSAEMERYNTLVDKAITKAEAMGRDVPQAWRDLQTATEGVTAAETTELSTFENMTKRIGERILIYASFGEAIRLVKDLVAGSVDAYAKAESAEMRLGVALQTQGLAIPNLLQQYKDLAQRYQETTTYSHTAIEGAEALFVQLGNVGPAMMDRALKAATDLSSGLGIDLNSAVELLSKAAEGQTQSFTRYGIVLDQARVKSEGFGYVLDAIEAKVGGQAAAELDTYAGQVKAMSNAWDDVKEAIGRSLITNPVVQEAIRNLTELTKNHASKVRVDTDAMDDFAMRGAPQSVQAFYTIYQAMRESAEQANAYAGAVRSMPALPAAPGGAFINDQLAKSHQFTLQYLDDQEKAKKAADEAAKAFQSAVKSMVESLTGSPEKMKALSAAVQQLGGVANLTGPELGRLTKQADELVKQGAQLPPSILQATHAFDEFFPKVETGIKDFKDLGVTLPPLRDAIDTLQDKLRSGTIGLEAYGFAGQEAAVKVDAGFTQAVKDGEKAQRAIDAATKQSEQDLQELARAFDELGRIVGGDIGNVIASLGSMVSALEESKKAFDHLNDPNASHSLLSNIADISTGIMGIVSAAAAAGSAIKGLYDHFFGTAGRDKVVDFANSMGGFDALHAKLQELGQDGENLWIALTQGVGRNNPQQAQTAIDAINKALGDQKSAEDALRQSQNSQMGDLISKIQAFGGAIDPALDPYITKLQQAGILTDANAASLKALEGSGGPTYETLQQLQQKYNLTAAQMGPSFQTQQIDANFQTIIDDLDTLTRGGADLTTALFTVGSDGSKSLSGLGKAVDDDIEAAIKAGVQIPANLEPAAKALFDQGDLVDANGKKITDFNTLSFGETMQTSLDNLNKTLKDLIDKLANGMPAAIKNIPSHVDITFNGTKSGFWPSTSDGSDGSQPKYHAGTEYVQRFHRGTAKVLPFPFANAIVAHSGLLPDEVPAILQTGESVLNRRATAALGPQAIGALNRGDGVAGGSVTIQINNPQVRDRQAIRDLTDDIIRVLPGRLARQLGKAS